MIPDWLDCAAEVVARYRREPAAGTPADWPSWLPSPVIKTLRRAGIKRPWRHQVAFAELGFAGTHAAITTATASGKTLGYLLPILAAHHGAVGVEVAKGLRSIRHTSLYLSGTKALAHDQFRVTKELGDDTWAVATLDGDSAHDERRFAREYADYVLTNPDMLHHAVLPNHGRWSSFLGSLRYIVVDEAHRYTGTFGAHVAAVIRRLRRLSAHYGANPTVLLASATSPNAANFGGHLIGEPEVAVVSENTAKSPGLDFLLWRPATTTTADASRLLAGLVDSGAQTALFVASRNLAEVIAAQAQEHVTSGANIAAYRAGYLAPDRRKLEAQLNSGALAGVAATNALELGVDITGLDAVVLHGFPGTLGAMWQQVGRAGRSEHDALAVLVAKDDPLDAYLLDHPELLFERSVEHQVLYPENPFVLGPQLAAAADEAPLRVDDTRWFGEAMPALADHLAQQGLLRKRPAGWFWTRAERASTFVSLRDGGEKALDVIERDTGRVIGTVGQAVADKTLHPGAIYLHQGEQYLVVDYAPDEQHAIVVPSRSGYYTQPLSTFEISILTTAKTTTIGAGRLYSGDVHLTNQVVGYLRRDEVTGDVWDTTALHLTSHTMRTQATWWTLPANVLRRAGIAGALVGSAAHAMEHCAIGLLPAFVPCDRWDIGGVSASLHADTGEATVFVHDGLPGGAGFSRRGFDIAGQWLEATLQRLTDCRCESGCPACVVSPKCGNANQFLDRFAARDALAKLLG